MNRPYIFCHMMTSLDGKIMGNYMNTPEGGAALNWSFIQAGMCDETPVRFELQSAEVRNGGSVWLRYRVRPVKGA